MKSTTKFLVDDSFMGRVKLEEREDGTFDLYVGSRDIHIKPNGKVTPGGLRDEIVASGSRLLDPPLKGEWEVAWENRLSENPTGEDDGRRRNEESDC